MTAACWRLVRRLSDRLGRLADRNWPALLVLAVVAVVVVALSGPL